MTTTVETIDLAVCTDCLMVLANGDYGDADCHEWRYVGSRPVECHRCGITAEESDSPCAVFLAAWDRNTGGGEVTLGGGEAVHDGPQKCRAFARNAAGELTRWRGSTACDCENLGFSMGSCDLCDSHLGGDRFAATLWTGKGEPQ